MSSKLIITPAMRVHRILKKSGDFHSMSESPELQARLRRENSKSFEDKSYFGWFSNGNRKLVIGENAIFDIADEMVTVVRYEDITTIDGPHDKRDLDDYKIKIGLKDGSKIELLIQHLNAKGALVFTIMRFLLCVVSDIRRNSTIPE